MRQLNPSLGRRLRSASLRYQSPLCGEKTAAKVGSATQRRTLRRPTPSDQPVVAALIGGNVKERAARLEAVLFLARRPLSSRKLSQLANLADGTEARTLVQQLRQRYDGRNAAFQVEEVGGGYQLLTRGQFAPWLRRLQSPPAEVRLSAPAMETLAIVAYRGPVLRAEVESVRGVQCGEILRQLMERDLVRIAGRAEELGRPFLYAATKRFLQIFGLRSLEELPRAEQLRAERPMAKSEVENSLPDGQDNGTSKAAIRDPKESAEMDEDMTRSTGGQLPDEERPVLVNRPEDEKSDEDEYEYVDEDEEEDDEYEDGEETDAESDEEEYEYEEVDDLEEDNEEDEDDEWEEVDEDEEEDAEYEYEYEDDEED